MDFGEGVGLDRAAEVRLAVSEFFMRGRLQELWREVHALPHREAVTMREPRLPVFRELRVRRSAY